MLPTLFTFRRCPYAMRARWAIQVADVAVKMHEVALRDKPSVMLEASPKGTVPVLVLPDGRVIDESLEIMLWALKQHDPEGWLKPSSGNLANMLALIEACESAFKPHLDRYKYPSRYKSEWTSPLDDQSATALTAAGTGVVFSEQSFSDAHFNAAQEFLRQLSLGLTEAPALGGATPALADFAIVPFVRQMARHDRPRFEQAVPATLLYWMDRLLARADFEAVMTKQI
ncbi:glutathione S-transferase N-terminal domain-containing protein [Ottowia caeni]|uniref:glutathione S-transferase N-terminal domain-containing protein n=1 Tax=Ottowia caeni TaxID=2870339 RepID=UPI001E60C1F8|nr:glutathione S-transferase N-terminal domain-containing protein [Ottowia caeni]